MQDFTKLNWRTTWYSVLIWVLAFAIAGFVIVPWFYPVLGVTVSVVTIYYFKILNSRHKKNKIGQPVKRDNIFAFGLVVSLFWFFIILFLNFLEIIGFYYFDVFFYFSDFRNWYLYALILIIPVIYSLLLENSNIRLKKKRKLSSKIVFFKQAKI